jgi:hypothetical protein
MYLIDSYQAYFTKNNILISQEEQNHHKQIAEKNLKIYRSVCSWLFMNSIDAVENIPDNSLDFIYIDGDHRYEVVKKELELYCDKVKSNGIIAGHDFNSANLGVVKAVLTFASEMDWKVNGDKGDWWIIKE